MSLKLKHHEDVPGGLRRIIAERLGNAMCHLQEASGNPDKAIHDSRKRLKEARAVLRLLRPALPDALYQAERDVYRDTARPISTMRDARVLIDALDQLAAKGESALDVTPFRRQLETRHEQLQHELDAGHQLERLQESLSQALVRIGTWAVAENEWKTIRRGIEPAYRRGRRLLRRFESDTPEATDEQLHEWRKQGKTLWYQLEVLEHIWPGAIKTLGDEVHEFTDALGEYHDLSVLRELIAADGDAALAPDVREVLNHRIDNRRQKLLEDAFALGRRIYAEPASKFTRRIGQYWKAWRSVPSATEPPKAPPRSRKKSSTPAAPAS